MVIVGSTKDIWQMLLENMGLVGSSNYDIENGLITFKKK